MHFFLITELILVQRNKPKNRIMVSKSTSLNSGGRTTVFSFPMTDWNALLRLSLFTLLMTMVGLSRTQAQCTLMYNDPAVDVELTVDGSGLATLDAAAFMPLVTVTGAGCNVFTFYDQLGNPLTAPVMISCNGTGNGPGTYLATVEDAVPNLSNTVTFEVVLTDNIAPILTVPAARTISCEESKLPANTGMATATDNCASGLMPTYTDMPDTTMIGGCNNTGSFTRTWSVSDGTNTSTATQIITVQDVTPPTFSAPADITIDACNDNINDLMLTGDVTDEADNCSTGLNATFQDMPAVAVVGMCQFDSTITRVWTLVDDCNNTLQIDQIITKEDRSLPTSTQGTVSADNDAGVCSGSVMLELTAANTNDNCSAFADLMITNSFNAGGADASGSYPVGSTTVTFTIEDQCGNVGTHDVMVTVSDTTAPSITNCPADVTINNDPGNCDNTFSWTAPSVTDNCMGTIEEEISVSASSVLINTGTPGPGRVDFADFPVGTTTITYAFRDVSGVSDTCRFTVTVLDTEAPSVICPADQILDFGACNAANELVPDFRSLLGLTDNCASGINITQSPAQNTLLSSVAGITPADTETFMVTLGLSVLLTLNALV